GPVEDDTSFENTATDGGQQRVFGI
ncbi:MAG: hypothetical protein RL291_981, partial [Pseudomonadota bacterium]